MPSSGGSTSANYEFTDGATLTGHLLANSLKITTTQRRHPGPGQHHPDAHQRRPAVHRRQHLHDQRRQPRNRRHHAAASTSSSSTGAGTLTISAPIIANGANALTKAGPGTLALTGANTYTGQTYIDGGILNVNSDSALGWRAPARS